jgi:hypothetical protein
MLNRSVTGPSGNVVEDDNDDGEGDDNGGDSEGDNSVEGPGEFVGIIVVFAEDGTEQSVELTAVDEERRHDSVVAVAAGD